MFEENIMPTNALLEAYQILPLNLCQLFNVRSDHIISYISKNNQVIIINQSFIK